MRRNVELNGLTPKPSEEQGAINSDAAFGEVHVTEGDAWYALSHSQMGEADLC